ncbi:MAG: hypothetical protein ACOZQL_10540 [Myxococcota bacterium]
MATTYEIRWGHSGTQGKEWTTAQEASRYASEVWGEVEATSAEEAVAQVRREAPEIAADWYERDGQIHVVPAHR